MKTAQTLISLVFLCLASVSVALKSCQDPITCYLESLVITIPDFCVDEENICFSDFVCNGVFLTGVPSSYLPPTTLGVGVSGLGTACGFSYQYNRIIKGDVTASIMDTSLDIDLLVSRDANNYLPVATSFSYCNLTSMNIDITFSSSGLDYLAPIMERAIKAMVKGVACVKLADFFAVNVTNALVTTIDPLLEEIIASQPSPLPQMDSFYYINWQDSIIAKVHNLVDHISGLATGGEFMQCLVNESPNLIADLLESQTRRLLADEQHNQIHLDLRPYKIVASGPLPSARPAMNHSLTLTSLSITGFDTMTEMEILDPMRESNVSLHTYMGFDEIKLDIGLKLTITTLNEDGQLVSYTEELLAAFHVKDAFVLADMVVAVNQFLLNSYFMDQLATPACWLSALTEVSLANLQFHLEIEELSLTQVTGSAGPLEKDIVALIDNAFSLLVDGFGPLLTDTLNGLMQGPIRLGLNDRLATSIAQAKKDSPCLTHYPYSDANDWIKWSQSELISMVDLIVNQKIGVAGVNKVMNCLTNNTGTLVLNTTRLQVDVKGLNSFYELQVLAPAADPVANPYDLVNEIAMGYCPPDTVGTEACNPLRLMIASFGWSDNTNDPIAMAVDTVMRSFKLEMSLSNLDVLLDILLKMDKNGLKDLTFGQTQTNGCTTSTFEQFSIQTFKVGMGEADISINDGAHVRNVTALAAKVINALTKEEKVDVRNANMADSISNADATCRAGGVSPDATPDDTDTSESVDKSNQWKWEIAVLALGCFICLLILLWAYNYWGKARGLSCLAVDGKAEDGMSIAIDERTLWEKWECDSALVCEAKIPLFLRIAIPCVILGNMGLFINSNTLPDAVQVMVQAITPDSSTDPKPVFNFGLASTVHDMWEAKVYPLSILIAFFSGAWPYVKLAVMFVSWVLPPGLMKVERREKALIWLDILGKWSLIDFFVMVLMLCAFYFEMHMADAEILVTVLPKWGFYGFLLATMISLGLGHIILACHRLVTEHKVLPLPEAYAPNESMSSICYPVQLEADDTIDALCRDTDETSARIAHHGSATSSPTSAGSSPIAHKRTLYVSMTRWGQAAMLTILTITTLFIIGGCFLETMKFDMRGAVGLILQDKATIDYSLVEVGTSIPTHSGTPDNFGVRWLQVSFFLFCLGMPLGLMAVLFVLWVYPLSISTQRQLFVLSEVLNAWSALDVYSISILAALLEIQQFAAFIVGDSCDGINKLLQAIDDATDEKAFDGDAKCFDVVALLLPNSWSIFIAAVLVFCVGVPSLAIAHKAIHIRMQQTEDELSEHIRGHSVTSMVSARSGASEKKQRNSREYVPNADLDMCKPLIAGDDLEKAPGGGGSTLGVSANDIILAAQQNDTASVGSQAGKKKSLWQQCTMHNFNMLLLRCLTKAHLIRLTRIDTRLAWHKQQLALRMQGDSLSPTAVPYDYSENNMHVSPTVY